MECQIPCIKEYFFNLEEPTLIMKMPGSMTRVPDYKVLRPCSMMHMLVGLFHIGY
jgi:hypothetical protein